MQCSNMLVFLPSKHFSLVIIFALMNKVAGNKGCKLQSEGKDSECFVVYCVCIVLLSTWEGDNKERIVYSQAWLRMSLMCVCVVCVCVCAWCVCVCMCAVAVYKCWCCLLSGDLWNLSMHAHTHTHTHTHTHSHACIFTHNTHHTHTCMYLHTLHTYFMHANTQTHTHACTHDLICMNQTSKVKNEQNKNYEIITGTLFL